MCLLSSPFLISQCNITYNACTWTVQICRLLNIWNDAMYGRYIDTYIYIIYINRKISIVFTCVRLASACPNDSPVWIWHYITPENSHVWTTLCYWTVSKAAFKYKLNAFTGSMFELFYKSSNLHDSLRLQRGPECLLNYDIGYNIPHSRKSWRGIKFGGLAVYLCNCQIKIRQYFLLTYIRMVIWCH